ncbi:MAG: Rne/Rng family ribonuclease [Streptosporangiaceae bacterium]
MLENEPTGDPQDIAGRHKTDTDTTPDNDAAAEQPPRRLRRGASRPAGPPSEEAEGAARLTESPAGGGPRHGEEASGNDEGHSGKGVPLVTFQAPAELFESARVEDRDDGGESAPPEEQAERAGRRRRRRGGRGRGRAKDIGGDESGGNTENSGTAGAGGSSAAGGEAAAGRDGPGPADSGEESGSRRASGRKKKGSGRENADGCADQPAEAAAGDQTGPTRRRRRRRRRGSDEVAAGSSPDDPPNTVVKVREPRPEHDEVEGVQGSTRLEAKKQRRREGREQRRRRPPVITESEFLARRESVDRMMVARQVSDRTQIAVIEDGVLVEHYVDRATHQSLVGNVYLGKVQNVLPSMEAAFVDIGKGRNAVLYAGEVNYDASGLEGQPRRIEQALKSGQSVLVQATKDPIGHKGARLTSQVSLPGRYLVYVPEGSMTGISRKLPTRERGRLKQILKKIMPDGAGVIVRTAAEGASEEELSQDIARLTAQWDQIERKTKEASPPSLLYGEPDLTIRVVRDLFNEDFRELVVAGDDAWNMVDEYVRYVAPHLVPRLRHWTEEEDVFAAYRVEEQLQKALDRKVWLPSGGSLIIERTEAMVVVDVNTGKFTGKGGNLEETVTKNNLEAAEEIVRQLRLRDLGGIIVIDFIDMVLESNRELVLKRLLECLARDRTKHQVAEVTSLGLVQMTRKRVGQGLLEAFSQTCDCCHGRGVIVRTEQLEPSAHTRRGGRREAEAVTSARADEPAADQTSLRVSEGAEASGEEAAEGVVADAPGTAADAATSAAEPAADGSEHSDGEPSENGTSARPSSHRSRRPRETAEAGRHS